MNDIETTLLRPFILRFPVREQAMFAKRLAMILRSGVAMREGLAMLDTGKRSRSAAYIFAHIVAEVSRGQPLSKGLATFVSLFGPFSVNIIKVGEASGTLHQNLEYLSEELKKKEALKKKVIGVLVYPAVIIFATIGISTVLTIFIFPKILPIFQSFKQQLPISTRILIALSNFLIHDGWLFFSCLIVASAGFFLLLRLPRVRLATDRFILYVPLLGKLSRCYNVATISRTLSLLLRGNVGIIQALDIVAESSPNTVYQECLRQISAKVLKGQKLSVQIGARPELFPALCTQMISVGEETGNLASSLMYLSDMYEEEINDLTKNLTTLLEPVLMIVMGAVVGFIAVSIITPIYGITQSMTLH